MRMKKAEENRETYDPVYGLFQISELEESGYVTARKVVVYRTYTEAARTWWTTVPKEQWSRYGVYLTRDCPFTIPKKTVGGARIGGVYTWEQLPYERIKELLERGG